MKPRFEVVRDRLRCRHRLVGHSFPARLPGLLYRLRKGMAVNLLELLINDVLLLAAGWWLGAWVAKKP